MSDIFFMQAAYGQALLALDQSEVPVGAVVVKNGEIIGAGYNQVISRSNPCAHAEILAIEQAGRALSNYRLNDTSVYVTLEPCAMCAAALVHARVARLIFAVRDIKAGAAGSVLNLLSGKPFNHRVIMDEGILEKPCADLLKTFFITQRQHFNTG